MAKINSITLEVYWNRLITIMGETDLALLRTAVSSVIGEGRDFAFFLLDADANGLVQSATSLAVFTGILPYTVRTLLEYFPPKTLQDGDILFTNDPWIGSGHLPDFCWVKPVFYNGRIIAYITAMAHMVDIGGSLSYFEARDVFEEGTFIPPIKLYKAGKPNEELFSILRANSRLPEMYIGDVRAVMAAVHVCAERLREFLEDYGLEDLKEISANIQDRSEQVMRKAIQAIPEGVYRHAVTIDGFAGELVDLKVAITVKGDTMVVDYSGSSPETFKGAINVCLNYMRGSTYSALKSALAPDIPNNEGLFRPITMVAPQGSIANCRPPVPVKGRSVVAVHAPDVVFGALVPVIADQVMAGSGTFWGIWASGRHPDGTPSAAVMLANGGMGGNCRKDGLATTAYPWNIMVTPTEIFENQTPVFVSRKELINDSGGDGTFRGGLGQRIVFTPQAEVPVAVSLRPVNLIVPPPGLEGGQDGSVGRVLVNGKPTSSMVFTLNKGDELVCELPGGGGFGAPEQRTADRRRRDREDGYTSR